jgi:carboxyl-terminal processing protease
MYSKGSWTRIVVIVLLVGTIFIAGYAAGATHPTLFAMAADNQPVSTVKLFQPFWQTWNLVHEQYVDPIDDQKLMQGAATGMVAALGDAHSEYMDPQTFNYVNGDLTGRFEGIGATIRKDEKTGGILIISTIAGAPARQGGVKAGDIIIKVDGKDITNLTEGEVLSRVRGQAGTPVKLSLLRTGQKNLVDVTLTRAVIKLPNVESALYEGKIGYVKLSRFSDTAEADLKNALKQLDADHLNGLVFDLRDNPGGGLQTAINVASAFIEKGTIVIERGKENKVFTATGHPVAAHVPMVVLINGGSASASELVSAALKDYGRAQIVGTLSYGKGSVQIWNTLNGGGGVAITVAHFFSPKDHIINDRGITPNLVVPWDSDTNPTYDPQLAAAFAVLRGEL